MNEALHDDVQQGGLDTSDMISLHQVFRDALDRAPDLVAGVTPGDADRATLVATYYTNVFSLLHSHHDGEDLLLTPRLLARAPERADDLARIAGQHQQVLGALDDVEKAIPGWAVDPTTEATASLRHAMQALQQQLEPHLAEEEREVLPLASRHITAPEWGELPAHGMQHFGGDKLWLVLGLIRDRMSPTHLALMDAHMPPPAKQFWEQTGEGLYRSLMAELARS